MTQATAASFAGLCFVVALLAWRLDVLTHRVERFPADARERRLTEVETVLADLIDQTATDRTHLFSIIRSLAEHGTEITGRVRRIEVDRDLIPSLERDRIN